MKFYNVCTFVQALSTAQELLAALPQRTQVLPLEQCLNKRAAIDVTAKENLPDFARSTVDGYACRAVDTYGATESIPSLLRLVGKLKMGQVTDLIVEQNQCVYVPTGAFIPNGATASVMIEHCRLVDDCVAVFKPVAVRENVIGVGDDAKLGDLVIRRGERLTAAKCGVLAALGYASLPCYLPLNAAVISTGDELVQIDAKAHRGQVRDVNTTLCASLCAQYGINVVSKACITDGYQTLCDAVSHAVDVADIVLISGGSSVGAKDFTEQVLSDLGEINVHGIALKPGKPTLMASVKGKAVFGLPGHPMACMLTMKLLVADALFALYGDVDKPYVTAFSAVNFPSSAGRLTVQPVRLSYGDVITATPVFYKSALILPIASADGYCLIEQNQEGVNKGQPLRVYLL